MSNPVKQKAMEKHLYDYRGFINYQSAGLNVTEKAETNIPAINVECIKMLDTFINICNENKIKLIFIYPPEFYNPDEKVSKEIMERKKTIDSMVTSAGKKYNFYYRRFDTNDFHEKSMKKLTVKY